MPAELSESGRRRIHERTLELLAEEGMQVEHAEAREELAAAGATIEDEMVRLEPELVEEAVAEAPSSFTWEARDPTKRVEVGTGDPVVAPTRGARYVKRAGENRRRAMESDFELLVKLVHQEPTVDVVGYDLCSPQGYSLPGNPGGFEQAAVGYELLEGLFTGTDKPILASARRGEEARASLEMAAIAYRDPDLTEHYVLAVLHTRSPRLWNEPIVAGMLEFVRAGQPLAISSGAIASASGPHSLAETAVLMNAESLFGVVFAQLVNPGTPVVFGHSSTVYDRNAETVTYGTPRGSVFSTVAVEMGDFYDLPVRGNGADTDAKALDDQSGSDSMFHVRGAVQAGADLLLNAVGVLDTHEVVSPEKIVLDAERIRGARAAQDDLEAVLGRLEEDSVSLDTISAAEPGAYFYDGRDPDSLPDASRFEDEMAVRIGHDEWLADGAESLHERANQRVEALLADYERPAIDPEAESRLATYVEEHSSR
jgi:trimethylamine--corrinoid protein Co-methyltransferase